MKAGRAEEIANAILYEGYLLYPYRSSAIKNQQRFNFGVLYPREYCEQNPGADAWEMQTECLVRGGEETTLEIKTRFLQLVERAGRQEGIERDAQVSACSLLELQTPIKRVIAFESAAIEGELELRSEAAAGGTYRLTLQVRNNSVAGDELGRDEMLLRSLVSVHSILTVNGGAFVSLLDPPGELLEAARNCRNIGCWPVLVGGSKQTDMMLASPIILYDYPEIAPESSGDWFDGTEIDEILALRILTLTDAEKLEVRQGDERARRILERTEMLPAEQFQKLHGAMRGLGPRSEGQQ